MKPKKSKRTKKKKSEYYVNPKDFLSEIEEYYKTDGPIPESLAVSILKIAKGLSYAPNFINYSYKEEMIGDAVVKMITALENKKFKLGKTNPFGYFTTIAFHAFINRIKKEKKYHDTITEYQETVYARELTEGDNSIYVRMNKSSGYDDEQDY